MCRFVQSLMARDSSAFSRCDLQWKHTHVFRLQQLAIGIHRIPQLFADDVRFDAVFVDGYSDAWSVGEMELTVFELPSGVGCVL